MSPISAFSQSASQALDSLPRTLLTASIAPTAIAERSILDHRQASDSTAWRVTVRNQAPWIALFVSIPPIVILIGWAFWEVCLNEKGKEERAAKGKEKRREKDEARRKAQLERKMKNQRKNGTARRS
ncbi:hypothetical protein F5Y15DRAFT_411047 [Xylariaceae sp. FL0016]|nr:hypothetical protein F5Y15DRAFT_411047 [Xylariaceae sp. FL0016]